VVSSSRHAHCRVLLLASRLKSISFFLCHSLVVFCIIVNIIIIIIIRSNGNNIFYVYIYYIHIHTTEYILESLYTLYTVRKSSSFRLSRTGINNGSVPFFIAWVNIICVLRIRKSKSLSDACFKLKYYALSSMYIDVDTVSQC